MASAGIPPPVRVLGDNNLPDVDRLMEQNVSVSGVHDGEVPRHSTLSSIPSKPNEKGRNSNSDNALLAREALRAAQPVSPLTSIYQFGIGNAHSFQSLPPQSREWSSASTLALPSSSCQTSQLGNDKPEPELEEEDILEPSIRPCKKTKTEHTTDVTVDEKNGRDWWLAKNSGLYLIARELNLDEVEVREWAERLRARQEARRAGVLG